MPDFTSADGSVAWQHDKQVCGSRMFGERDQLPRISSFRMSGSERGLERPDLGTGSAPESCQISLLGKHASFRSEVF